MDDFYGVFMEMLLVCRFEPFLFMIEEKKTSKGKTDNNGTCAVYSLNYP
jgi:hypothetical protein